MLRMLFPSHDQCTTGVTAMSIGRTNALTTFGTVPIVGTRTAGDNTTYAASTAFVTSAVAGVPISDYLPLTAGSGSPLTGDLYITKNSPVLTITDTAASDLKLEIKQSGSTSNFMSRGGTSSKGQFNFRITDGSTVTNALFINQQANVGIGTNSPGTKLEIAGGDQLLELNTTLATGNPYMMWSQAGTRRSYMQHVNSNDNLTIASEYGGMVFMTGINGAEVERMRITSTGNVGIGTTSPLQPLSIESSTSPLIKIRNTTNGEGAAIEFNDTSGSAATRS